ncbi:DUF2326 domain-containing protein [Vibrio parahaemolyticus]|uniref:DUF2326 domain-containing protein n=9 Tax=Gammaproteobacteria TaxID=1236 RepID=A0A2S3QZK6_VIBVL|nr:MULTISPECIES: DUF2326 domain-containing protein [Gammaproteobacteria]EGR4207042.1 DUF2326 domain-containing protein [Vibrio cholerae]MCG6227368.1 DUF2326 domain-containing protein [Vibrio furnissii]QCO85130.1 DUF2326 domain-containing protein [Vibrio neocaledonicus]MBE4062317.1 DUF2326 domain-containing protein [Vibrio parahaemolyticus]MBE4388330.1 DUF2326 domain-containing protein [Vibrio parahaemolyticus]
MFIKKIIIATPSHIIREIPFHKGLNLVVDESDGQVTGNSVGKTTVLKLIDFCLGAKPKIIYEDPENKKEIYSLVKGYLVDNNVSIFLYLSENLDDENSRTVVIERNFLARSKIIRKIDGIKYTESEFEDKLTEIFFPSQVGKKPTFRQIISHNIRYSDLSVSNTLKTLDNYTSDAEYETLYLYLLGCDFSQGSSKQKILQDIHQENVFKNRLEKVQTKSAYEAALAIVETEIDELDRKKSSLNINENFERDLNKLNKVRYEINRVSNDLGNLNLRKDLIEETKSELSSTASYIDLSQLESIYNQASNNLGKLNKTFGELVSYHNKMVNERISYITKELPIIESKIKSKNHELNNFLKVEKDLAELVSKSSSFEDLEVLISKLNDKYRDKGEFESIISQLIEVEENIQNYESQLSDIDNELFSDEFEAVVKQQVNRFNKHFSATSQNLYGEKYALKYDKIINKKGQRLYKFSAFNTNFSSGKKQGEISCFDIAYTLFADEENIPCMHFLLNDKKELMHDNQLVKIADLVDKNNVQFVASILKDKLPDSLNNEDYFVVKLSESDKLFRIEYLED